MALIPCRECNVEVSTSAKNCPHCGVKWPGAMYQAETNKRFGIFIGGFVAFIIVIGSAASIAGKNAEPTKASATVEQTKPAQAGAAVPARSSDERVAEGIATMIAYDLKCETMPLAFKDMADAAMETVATSTLQAAMQRVLTFYKNAGPAKFCAANKPVIDRAMANYRP